MSESSQSEYKKTTKTVMSDQKITKYLIRGRPILIEELGQKDQILYCLVRWGIPETGKYKKFYLDYEFVAQEWPDLLITYYTNRCMFLEPND